jgi:hypothetical protein
MPNVYDDDEETLQFADESDALQFSDESDADDVAAVRAENRTQEELDEIRSETDPPSPAAELLDALITYTCDQSVRWRFGDVADTCPAGIGEGAVHVRDDQANAEFLIIAVEWQLATSISPDNLHDMWYDLVARTLTRKAQPR